MIFERLVPSVQHGDDPTVPPRRERPNSRSVSLTALKSRVNRIFLLARIKRFNSCGKVKTRSSLSSDLIGCFARARYRCPRLLQPGNCAPSRHGEGLGLMWRDIDLDQKEITIRRKVAGMDTSDIS